MFQNTPFGEHLCVPLFLLGSALAQRRPEPTLQKTGIIGIILTSWDVGIMLLRISQGCRKAHLCLVRNRRLINVTCLLNYYKIVIVVIMSYVQRGQLCADQERDLRHGE